MMFVPTPVQTWESLCERCGYTGQIPAGVHMDVLREAKVAIDQAKAYADRKNWRMSEVYVRSAVAMLQSPDAGFVKKTYDAWSDEKERAKIQHLFARLSIHKVSDQADIDLVVRLLAKIDAAFVRQNVSELDQVLLEYERKATLWQKK